MCPRGKGEAERGNHEQQADDDQGRGGLDRGHPAKLGGEPAEIDLEHAVNWYAARREALQRHRLEIEDDDTDDEDDPALEEMQEAFRLADAETVNEKADDPDAERVHEDGDRQRRQEEDDLVPGRALVENREQEAETRQREEVPQTAARLRHLKLVGAEIDDIAVEEDRNAEP